MSTRSHRCCVPTSAALPTRGWAAQSDRPRSRSPCASGRTRAGGTRTQPANKALRQSTSAMAFKRSGREFEVKFERGGTLDHQSFPAAPPRSSRMAFRGAWPQLAIAVVRALENTCRAGMSGVELGECKIYWSSSCSNIFSSVRTFSAAMKPPACSRHQPPPWSRTTSGSLSLVSSPLRWFQMVGAIKFATSRHGPLTARCE